MERKHTLNELLCTALTSYPCHMCVCCVCVCVCAQQSCDAQSGYIDYGGALRCMVENSGEVAWVKHTTPTDFSTTGTSRQPWSVSTVRDLGHTRSHVDTCTVCPYTAMHAGAAIWAM